MANIKKNTSRLYLNVPISRLVWMGMLTCGLYEAYWIYQNYRLLASRGVFSGSPFVRAILGVFYMYSLLTTIKSDPVAQQLARADFSARFVAVGWIGLFVLGCLTSHSSNVYVYVAGMIISACSVLFLVPVQRYLNLVTRLASPDVSEWPWTWGQGLCLIIGMTFISSLLISFLMPN